MSRWQKFLIVVYPVTLFVVTVLWFFEDGRVTWKEMYRDLWEA